LELYNYKNGFSLEESGPQGSSAGPQGSSAGPQGSSAGPQGSSAGPQSVSTEPVPELMQELQLSLQLSQERENMLFADVESHELQKHVLVLHHTQSFLKLEAQLTVVKSQQSLAANKVQAVSQELQSMSQRRQDSEKEVTALKQQLKQFPSLKQEAVTLKQETVTLKQSLAASRSETLSVREKANNKVSQLQQTIKELKKALQESQAEIQMGRKHASALSEQVEDQQQTIRHLQDMTISLSEKLADADGFIKTAKCDVSLATDLSNGLSEKCIKLQEEHAQVVTSLKRELLELNKQLESQKASNVKVVQRAVELQKKVNKLSKVSVMFQVDQKTTEEVIRDSYTDLQKFLEEKALQMEHVLALVAYAIVHLKYVLERFVLEQFEQKEPMELPQLKEFLQQVVNHLTRIFLLVPLPIMLRNVDRLSELAASQCVSIKALHMIQFLLPKTIEEAQGSRQRVVLENFPQLSTFFTRDFVPQDETVSMSVHGFMMLLGISK
jgi:chromosome segregation ATPase